MNVVLTHSTGSPFTSDIIELMTRAGHEGSLWEIMSFVPRAMTSAVGFFAAVSLDRTTPYASLVLRPRLKSMPTEVHTRSAVTRLERFPKTVEPSSRLSPTMTRSP